MNFFSNTRKPERKREDFTNTKVNVYRKEIDRKTGERRLVVDKQEDIYEKIQEYAEETKLSNILSKYNVNMLQRLKSDETQMVDLTNLPENLLETMTIVDNAKYLWERQSKELKAQFDNDFRKFIAGSENGQIMDILTKSLNTKQEQFNTTAQANYTAPQKTEASITQPSVQPTQTTTTNNGGMTTNV